MTALNATDEYLNRNFLVFEHTFYNVGTILYQDMFIPVSIGFFGQVWLTVGEDDLQRLAERPEVMQILDRWRRRPATSGRTPRGDADTWHRGCAQANQKQTSMTLFPTDYHFFFMASSAHFILRRALSRASLAQLRRRRAFDMASSAQSVYIRDRLRSFSSAYLLA